MPGSNIRYQGAKTVKDGFRHAVFSQLGANRAGGGQNKFILTNTLLVLNGNMVEIDSCPACKAIQQFVFLPEKQVIPCSSCGSSVYMTDWLRLHEGVSDFGDNTVAITRMMNCVEHLLLAAFIQQVFDADAVALSKMAFVMDGPLAIFGQPAKLHARIMEFLYKVNYRLAAVSYTHLLEASINGLNQYFKVDKTNSQIEIIVDSRAKAEGVGSPLLAKVNVDHLINFINNNGVEFPGGMLSLPEVANLWAEAYGKDQIIEPSIGVQCAKCEFRTEIGNDLKSGFHECWKLSNGWEDKDFEGGTVLDLWNFRGKNEAIRRGARRLSQITQDDIKYKDGDDLSLIHI